MDCTNEDNAKKPLVNPDLEMDSITVTIQDTKTTSKPDLYTHRNNYANIWPTYLSYTKYKVHKTDGASDNSGLCHLMYI